MKYLALGPAGMGIFSLIGYLYKIRDKLDDVEEISGASAGAMIGFLMALGKDIDFIVKFIHEFDIQKYYKFSLKNFINDFGFINIHECKKDIIDLIGYNPKFKDLDKKLIISVINVNYQQTEYFSIDNYPDMYALDAVCISMSIPFIFTSKNIKGNYYADGGVFEQVPLTPFLSKRKEDVLAIQVNYKNFTDKKISNVKDYMFFIYDNFMRRGSFNHDKKLFNVIQIEQEEGVSLLNFKMNAEDKMKLFFNGYNAKGLVHSGFTM
jgi:predicted acylesterase/phospholipase RssA